MRLSEILLGYIEMDRIDNRVFVAAAFVALISIFPFDTGFYTFTRIVLSLSAICAVFKLLPQNDGTWIPFALLGVLYNPIIPVYLNDKEPWIVINLITAIGFAWLYRKIDKSSRWTDFYIFWAGRLALIGMTLFTLTGIIILADSNESFPPERVFPIMFAFAASGPIAALVINKIFFGVAKVWLSEIPSDEKKDSGDLG
jgi:hypothetical protein